MKIDFVIAQRKEEYSTQDEIISMGQSYQYTFLKAFNRIYLNNQREKLIDVYYLDSGHYMSGLNIIAGETYDE